MNMQEVAPIVCPQCQTRYTAPVTSIINVTATPELKSAFLRGQINVTECPQCGYQGEVSIPMLYFDADKELALVVSPSSLHLNMTNEQKIIGDLTNKLMNSLPADQRKAYLFNPKTFLTVDSLRKAVLEADGITEEMLEAQSARAKLLDQMLRAKDEAELRKMVETHDAELDRSFFEILSVAAFNAMGQGQQEQGQFLLTFRQMVAEMSSNGQQIVAEIDEEMGIQTLTPERVIENLLQAEDEEEFSAIVQAARPMIDYTFFQSLTNRIDGLQKEGKKDEAQALKTLRSRILDTSAKIEEEERQQISAATQLLQQLLQASDPKSFIQQNLSRFDEAFFMVLGNQIEGAAQAGKEEVAKHLSMLHQLIAQAIDEQMPPELKLLSRLMQTESPEAVRPLLQAHKAELTPRFMELLDRAIADLRSKGQAQLAEQLTLIKKEAEGVKQTSSIILP